nr:glycosyltransferase family 2 protein [Mucilaginibacter straminoryzae]
MTTYNGEKYLEEQLLSLFNQTLKPAEIIVCDDCSTDGTQAILKKYSDQHLLTYYVNEYRLGVIANFKKAVSLAQKDHYIALCDQDDIWLPHKLQQCVDVLTEVERGERPAIAYSDLVFIDSDGNVLNKSFHDHMGLNRYAHNLETELFNNFINGCTILMNPAMRNLIADMPDDVPFHDAWIGLLGYTFGDVGTIRDQLICYRRHSRNVSIEDDANAGRKKRFKRAFEEFAKALNGKDDFLGVQFTIAQQFYKQYRQIIPADKRPAFEHFLKLKDSPYLIKRLAFRKMIKKNLL